MSCNFRYNNTYNTIVPCKNNKNIKCPKEKESWLFSLDIAKGTWRPKSTNSIINVLQFRKNDVKLLKFTDRPLRLEKNVEDVATTLDYLFNENSVKSFSIDPPNAVLTIKTNQKAFEIKQVYVTKHGVVTMFLYDIQSHHDIYFQPQKHSGPMNLFIDSATVEQVAAIGVVAGAQTTAEKTAAESEATWVGVFYTKGLLANAVNNYCTNAAASEVEYGYDINDWIVGGITDMSSLFSGKSTFDGDITSWNVSSVTDMSSMFSGASTFNGDISSWDVSNVVDMSNMFNSASIFNGDISSWDVSSVTDMSSMFSGASMFNQNIDGWVTTNVADMSNMFYGALIFDRDIEWVTSSVTSMSGMFQYAAGFNGNIDGWVTDNVTDMSNMFNGASIFNRDITWYTISVTSMSGMFQNAAGFNGNIDDWHTDNVTDMSNMFNGASIFNRNITTSLISATSGYTWNTRNVNNMTGLFQNATKFNGNIDSWDTSSVTVMSYMFKGAYAFNRDISSWDVKNVTNMEYMFALLGTDSTGYGTKKSKFDFSHIVDWKINSLTTITGIFNGVLQTQYGDKWIPNPYQGKPGLKIQEYTSVINDFINITCSWSKINPGLPYGCCGGPAQYVTCQIKVVVDSDSDSDYYSDTCPSDGECPKIVAYSPPSPSSSRPASPACG